MKEYNKEKLHEYVNLLAKLCREKGLIFNHYIYYSKIEVMKSVNTYIGVSYTCSRLYNYKSGIELPIWELIEKVKAL